MRRTIVPCFVLGSLALAACGDQANPTSSGTASTSTSTSTGAGGGGTGGQSQGGGGQAPAVGSIDIMPEEGLFCQDSCFEMSAGVQRQFVAKVKDEHGAELTTIAVTWSTSDGTIVSVDANGKVKALKKGQTSLTASAGGKSASQPLLIYPAIASKIVVTPDKATTTVGGAIDFDAVAYDLSDTPILDPVLTWVTSNGGVATIGADGVATAAADGTVAVLVASEGGGSTGAATLVVGSGIPTATPFTLAQVSAGGGHSCGLDLTGQAYCWGWNFYGELGDGGVLPPDQSRPTPAPVKGNLTFTSIVAGEHETCAITTSGAAYCWGSQEGGSLGNGMTAPGPVTDPGPVVGGHTFAKMAMGGGQTCGITTTGDLLCWGLNAWGTVGDGSFVSTGVPVAILKGTVFTDVVAGLYSTCALRADGHALCWGDDAEGQLGQGTVGSSSPTPVPVTGNHVFTKLDMYGSFVCGIDDAKAIWCWGRNDTGQIGVAGGADLPTPTKIASPLAFVDVTAGAFHACGLATDGHVVCWGDDGYGQLGDASLTASLTPVDVAGGLVFADLESGSHHTCGVTTTKGAYCWGSSFTGQLGGGFGGTDAHFSITPWPVSMPIP